MRDAEITCPNGPSCSSSCSGSATGRTTARSAPNTTRQQPGSTPTSPGVIRAAPSCTAGSPARCAACPTRTTAASWKRCSPAGPPSSSSIPPPPNCSTRTGESPARGQAPDLAGPPVFAAPSVGLRPFIEQAFTREHVTIDFAGFSGETLHGVVQEPLDKIRIGLIKPATVTIRLLLPDTSRPMVLPCRADDLTDDPDYRTRMHRLTFRHAHAILACDLTSGVVVAGYAGVVPACRRGVRRPPRDHLQVPSTRLGDEGGGRGFQYGATRG